MASRKQLRRVARGKARANSGPVGAGPAHETPCVCGPYDRCLGQRTRDAARANTKPQAIREMFRAYND